MCGVFAFRVLGYRWQGFRLEGVGCSSQGSWESHRVPKGGGSTSPDHRSTHNGLESRYGPANWLLDLT